MMYQQETSGTMYKKRPGTSGIRGQLYETKLISLLLYRARHNDDIEDIHLASNVDEIGAFDDICFRAKVRGYDRPVAVFIQAKHRENNKALIVDDENDLTRYFDSYLKIRRAFKLNNENVLFDGTFEETECLFVLYTTANCAQNKNLPTVRFARHLNDLISTDGTIGYHPSYDNESVELLCKLAIKEQMTILAITIAKFICDKAHFRTLLNDELVLRYHVILSQKVMFISEIQPAGHRVATFREDFFTSTEEFLTSFKETLFMEVLKGRKPKLIPVCIALDQCFNDLPSPDVLCDLIGNVVTYNKHGKLEFIDKTMQEDLKHNLNEVDVCQFTVNTAINLAGKKMLSARSFKVPAAFGNKDLTIRGNDEKIEKRLNHLTSQIYDLLEKPHPNNIVTIDETLGKGFLQVNGGIASAVGNLLVSDENSKMMKFTDDCELLGKLSNRLFKKLKVKIQDLHKYKFEVKVKNFPKLSLECSEQDKNMVKDFRNNLIFYTNQGDENRVEEILKNEIESHEFNNASNFRVRSDAIYLTYHDEIQKWWMSPKEGFLLTKHTITHDTTISRIVEQPLLRIMNVIFRNKLNNNITDFTFREDALTSLKNVLFLNTMIVTDAIAVTAAKVLQALENKDYFVLDLEYLLNLPASDCNELCAELMNTSENKILIFVCENVLSSRNLSRTFEKIAKAIFEKMKIIITNQVSVEMIKKQFPQFFYLVNDESNNLISMSVESRGNILKNSKVLFQDVLISLDLIIDENSLAIIEGDVLNSVVSKKTIVVGKSLGNSNYEEIKHLYVNRWASRNTKKNNGSYVDKKIKIRTLNDIPDDVVLITAKPGMGKSTLLTHISLGTKKLNPNVWIIKINLLEHAREFSKWRENKTKIDLLESLNFMCHFVVSEKHGQVNNPTIELEESNGIVRLKHCLVDQWTLFELNLFLHFFNRGQIIFVFDGFDEICPHYMKEVMEFLKSVRQYPQKHKMWIASRSYDKIKSILQHEFGKSYEILKFNSVERVTYIHKFWKTNLLLKEFNKEQLENVYDFVKFINEQLKPVGIFGTIVKLPNLLLQEIYLNAFYYIKFEVKNTYIPLWTFETKFDDDTHSETVHSGMRYNGDTYDYYDMHDFFGTPLHLYLLVNYFQAEMKDVSKKCNKWNLDINTLTIYDRFLETKLKKIRFQEKNKMDIYNPDILFTYEKERADFITKHQKMAAYAIFNGRNNLIFNRKELKEIKNMIKLIKRGEEKTGVIYSVTSNNTPIFIHRSFAEYFAVEYFCDILKKEKCTEKQKTMMNFIFNVMFFEISSNVRNILDSKIKMDKALMTVLQKNGKAIFDLLMEQTKGYPAYGITDVQNEFYEIKYESSFHLALSDNLNNFVSLFISIFKTHLTKDNVDNFIKIINETSMFDIAIRVNCEEFITFALDIVRNVDESKFRNLFSSRNFSCFVNLSSNSNEEILEILREIAFLTTSTTTPYCMYDPDTHSYYFVLKQYH